MQALKKPARSVAMALKIALAALEHMKQHAESSYPEECCGLLLGSASERKAVKAWRMRNAYPGPKNNRYSLDPLEYAAAEESALREGIEVVGIYHSHPDHPALPSAFDAQHAWPWYAYVILSVYGGTLHETRCFYFDEAKRSFIEEPLTPITVL